MRYLILAIVILFQISLAAQSQKTLITKRTATWCPFCGSWGWDFAKALEEKENPNAIVIRAHYSGDLTSQVATEITSNFGGIYQPEFYIGEERNNVGSSTWMSKVDEFNDIINSNAEGMPNISFSAVSTISGNSVSLDVEAISHTNMDGEYYLAAYLLEDNVINFQSNRGNDAVHNNVLRASFTESSFGEEFFNGSAENGFKKSYSFTIQPEGGEVNDRMFDILIVAWKKVDSKYQIENIDFFEAGLSTSIPQFVISEQFKIYTSNNRIMVEKKSESAFESSLKMSLFAADGRLLRSYDLNFNEHMELPFDGNRGVYFYRITDKNSILQTGKLNF